jgi:hypothetical protein
LGGTVVIVDASRQLGGKLDICFYKQIIALRSSRDDLRDAPRECGADAGDR